MSEQQTPDGAEGADRPAPGGTTEPVEPVRTVRPTGSTPRRAPRYLPFVVTGVVLGIVIALGAVLLRPEPVTEVSFRAVLGYLGSIGALLGGVLGALVAVLVDGRIERQRGRDAGMGD